MAQGKMGALGRNAVNSQPVSTLPVPGNQTAAGLQLKNAQVLWDPAASMRQGSHIPGSLTAAPAGRPRQCPHYTQTWPCHGLFLVGCEVSSQQGEKGRRWDLWSLGKDQPCWHRDIIWDAAPLTTGQRAKGPQPAPELSNYFRQSQHNPQVNSDFLFIRFGRKTKRIIKKPKHKT